MKILRIIIIVSALAACRKPQASRICDSAIISTIHDITDSMQCVPIPDPILALFDFEHDKNKEAVLRLVLITDKQLNPVEQIHLDNGTASELNNKNEEVDYREQLIFGFYDQARNAFSDFHTRYIPYQSLKRSECYVTIASELVLLAHSKASQRFLIVFSDLQENTDVFTCYTHQGQRLLERDPDKVAKLLQTQQHLPDDLKGIAVYFVFNPRDRDEDARFSEMAAVYRKLLNARGAQVTFQATNKYYQP